MVSLQDDKNIPLPPRPSTKSPLLHTVLPGDDLSYYILDKTKTGTTKDAINSSKQQQQQQQSQPKLGPGLHYDSSTQKVFSKLAGRLKHRKSTNTYYILTNSRRYSPQINDRVIAIVEERIGEYYRVTIPQSSAGSALLQNCAFEGATKRNRPNLVTGSLLYARISVADPMMDTQVTCLVDVATGEGFIDGGAARKDWMTDEGTYGELRGGCTSPISVGLARELLDSKNVVLKELGKSQIPFEMCVGVNGVVWVHSTRAEYTIMILNAIRSSEVMTEEQVRGMVRLLISNVRTMLSRE